MKPNLIKIGNDDINSLLIKKIEEHHYSSPFHFHNLCELNYVVDSWGKRMVGDNIDNFSAGDLVLMSPNLPHIWYNDPSVLNNPSENKLAKAVVIYFPYDFLMKTAGDDIVILKTQKLLEKAKRGIRFYGKTQEEVTLKLNRIMEKNGFSKTIEFLEIMNILIESKEFEPLASVGFTHNLNEKDTERMNKVLKYIMQNFAKPISLNEIAEIANMTPPAFSGFFKKRTQKCFSSFLNEIRIGHACKLLQDLEIPISEICYLSGFQNFTNFNKFFKHFTGKIPREYRKHCIDLQS
ncbi:AraC family transcriptional regulator [Mucilaginibacter sabulilitoris]|uniref:AraC family transcriptional regulator n=1 Tax=Mucilaginibacter sabulilitoris TaxID=1173583 RepID=A0ABZ0THX2_9SPHI|nr:AraC family transcriptional regulator [Mucilaginibacter sabulilitoris]WPU92211.1 AraC family transcriptional regulator [Mucilaginibacter sabulilitoris]